jgi:16S rRNA (guanine966-N2)-methyltransferase
MIRNVPSFHFILQILLASYCYTLVEGFGIFPTDTHLRFNEDYSHSRCLHHRQQPQHYPSSLLWAKRSKNVNDSSSSASSMSSPGLWQRPIRAPRPVLGNVVSKYDRRPTTGSSSSAGRTIRPQGKPLSDSNLDAPTSLLKITGGIVQGRRLESPRVHLRPMMAKVKEAVFSSLSSLGMYDQATVRHLDIFSGSGSVGLESLSRGASHCTFVDFSEDCCQTSARNFQRCFSSTTTTVDETEIDKSLQVVCADYRQALQNPSSVGMDPTQYFHLVTLCPPYEEVLYGELLQAIANSPLIGEDTIILVEYPIELKTLPHVVPRGQTLATEDNNSQRGDVKDLGGALIGIRNRRYGRTVIAMYICNPTGKLPAAESRPEEFV